MEDLMHLKMSKLNLKEHTVTKILRANSALRAFDFQSNNWSPRES